MDIEGSEINALEGCVEICKKYAPKLAICIYHKSDDWITIPKKILELNKNYKFYMKHNSNNLYETVLFAICSTEPQKVININQDKLKEIVKIWNRFEYIYFFKRVLMYIAYHGLITTLKKAPRKIISILQKIL